MRPNEAKEIVYGAETDYPQTVTLPREEWEAMRAEIERLTEDRDVCSASNEACHRLLDAHEGQDPTTSSLETLEDRITGTLEEIGSLRSSIVGLTVDKANAETRRNQLRATLAAARKTVGEWKEDIGRGYTIKPRAFEKLLALLGEEGGK